MSATTRTDDLADPLALARHLDRVSSRFEAAWKAPRTGGPPPRLEDYLSDTPESGRTTLLEELIALDAGYRRQLGETPQATDYVGRFPDLDPALLAELCVAKPSANGAGRVLGKFRLLESVGRGAFGEVWRAHDTELDRPVAVKLPQPGLVDAPEHRARFLREARAAAQLRHPGIATIHEVTELDRAPAIVTEFVAGMSLRDLLKERRPTFREAAELVAEVAEALDYAHGMG